MNAARTLYVIERTTDEFVIDCDRDEATAWQVAIALSDSPTFNEPFRLVTYTLH